MEIGRRHFRYQMSCIKAPIRISSSNSLDEVATFSLVFCHTGGLSSAVLRDGVMVAYEAHNLLVRVQLSVSPIINDERFGSSYNILEHQPDNLEILENNQAANHFIKEAKVVMTMSSYEVNLLPAQRKFLELPENKEDGSTDVALYQ